jgi:hypothetical protein
VICYHHPIGGGLCADCHTKLEAEYKQLENVATEVLDLVDSASGEDSCGRMLRYLVPAFVKLNDALGNPHGIITERDWWEDYNKE